MHPAHPADSPDRLTKDADTRPTGVTGFMAALFGLNYEAEIAVAGKDRNWAVGGQVLHSQNLVIARDCEQTKNSSSLGYNS